MLTVDVDPAEKFRDYAKTVAPVMTMLEEGIERNIDLARKATRPHMRRYYVQVARLQNTWLLSQRRRLRDIGQEKALPARPPRKPYFAKRAGEKVYAPKADADALTPLVVALREADYSSGLPNDPQRQPEHAATPPRALTPSPFPEGPASQLTMFGDGADG